MRLVPLCRYGPDTFAAPLYRRGATPGSKDPVTDEKATSAGLPATERTTQQQVESTVTPKGADGLSDQGNTRLELVPASPGGGFLYVILCVRLSHCGQFIACGCSDGFVRIYRTPVIPEVVEDEVSQAEAAAAPLPFSSPLCRTLLCQKGNTSPVTCIAWRPTAPVRTTKAGHSRRAHGSDGYSHVFVATTGAGEIFQCALTYTQASAVPLSAASTAGSTTSSYSVSIIWKETIPDDQLLCCCYAPSSDLFAAAGSARIIYVIHEHSKKMFKKLDKPPALPCVKPVETAATTGKSGHLNPTFGAKGGKAKWAPPTQQKNEEESGDWLRLKQKPAAHYYAAAAAASRGAHANRITQLMFLKKFKLPVEETPSSPNSRGDRSAASKPGGALQAPTGKDDAFKNWNNKTLLLSAGADESVKLWDVDEGSCISSLADVAPLGDGVGMVSPTTVVVASSRNQQQVQLFTLPSFAHATTVDFNCTCTCPATLQPTLSSTTLTATKGIAGQLFGAAATATASSSSTNAKNDGLSIAALRGCGNGCRHYQEPSNCKATATAADPKCDEADLSCYIHACKALPMEGADLLVCGGSNRNQLRCYVRHVVTAPPLLPLGSASTLGTGPSSLSPSSRPAMKSSSNMNFSLFGLASFEAPPNTLDCISVSSLVRERGAGGGFRQQRSLAALPGVDPYSAEAVPGLAQSQIYPSEAAGGVRMKHNAEGRHAGGLVSSDGQPDLLRKDSDGNSESGDGAIGRLKKISFTAVFAKPQGGGAAEKNKNSAPKDSKQQQKGDHEKGTAHATPQKSGCLALVVTACYDKLHFFCVTPGPASLPAGFVDAVREQAQQQLEDRAQGALFRVLINHNDENEKKAPAPYAATSTTKAEGLQAEGTFDEVSMAPLYRYINTYQG